MDAALSTPEVVKRACYLAYDFHHRGDVSPSRLLQESGYLERRSEIDSTTLKQFLLEHPDLIGEWLVYSENKRVSSGWYFSANTPNGPYVVGHLPADPKRQEKRFTAAADACSTFVKCELEAMA